MSQPVVSPSPVRRRGVLAAGAAAGLAGLTGPALAFTPAQGGQPGDDRSQWDAFKRRFVDPSGRVIDTGNGGCSHTEGQGWGMLFAVALDDPDTFDLIHEWTARHLRRGSDSLHSWRYQPNAAVPVADQNNATDGDVAIAAALWRAAHRWGRPDHARLAAAIARDVLAALVVKVGQRTVLLPGIEGFTFRDSVTVNLSYYAFPFLADLAEAAPSPVWAELMEHGKAMIEEARYGQWRLPPDWLRISRVDGGLSPNPRWPARFSYDAIRIPLWLAWDGEVDAGAGRSFAAFWQAGRPVPPAWVDLRTNAVAEYQAPPGMVAVGCLATAYGGAARVARHSPAFPPMDTAGDYYSAALILLSRLAWRESRVT